MRDLKGGTALREQSAVKCLIRADRQIIDPADAGPEGRHGFREEVASNLKDEPSLWGAVR